MDFKWVNFGRALVLLVLLLFSISIGLIENGILRDEQCCGEDDMCYEVVFLEHEAFFDSATGLRTRYVLFVLFLFLSCYLRWLESAWIRPVLVFAVYEVTLIVALLTGDSAIRSFGNSPLLVAGEAGDLNVNGAADPCPVHGSTIETAMICSWFGQITSALLFLIATLFLPMDRVWPRPQGIVNLGYIHDMRNLGVEDAGDSINGMGYEADEDDDVV